MINTTPRYIYRFIQHFIFSFFLLAGLNGLGQCPGLNASFVPAKTEICTPNLTTNHVLTCTNTSTGTNAAASSYEWYLEPLGLFATTNNLNAPNPYTITGDGYATYILVGYNPINNCYDTAKIGLVVTLPPKPSFTINSNFQCAGSTVSFVNSSTKSYTTTKYLWNFGDGNTSAVENPTHTYANPGNYNVKLEMINNSLCIDSVIKVITIIKAPIPNFTFTNDNQCAGTVLTFTNKSTDTIAGTATYDWDFGDGSAHSTTLHATHVYTTAGTYTVTLTVSNGGNCKITKTAVVTVTSVPVATFTVAGGGCLGTVVSFNNTSTGISGTSSYFWDFGDNQGTSIAQNPSYTYTTPGTYPVKLTVSNGGTCSSTSAITNVIVKNTPVATFTFSNPTCTSTSVTFTNTSTTNGAAGTYLWNFGDAATSTTENPIHPYAANGSYNVTLTITDPVTLCSNTSPVTKITVGNLPPAINFTVTPLTGCSPQTVTFTNTSTGEDPVNNFDWNFGNGVTLSGVKNPPAQIYNQGTYTIRLISGNLCGKDTVDKTITIDTVPKTIVTTNTTKSCLPINFIATNNSTGGHLTYQWFVNGTLKSVNQTLPPQLFTTPSNTVQLKIANNCGTADTTIAITESAKVEATIDQPNITLCSAKDLDFTFTQTSIGDSLSYFWDFDNGNTSTLAKPPQQTFINPGVYHPILIVTGRCGKDTSSATLKVNPVPLAPTVSDTIICTGTSVTLVATAPGEKYEWFDAPNGTLLKIGASFKTPVLTSNQTYYVQSTQFDCRSPLKAVTVKVKPVPLPPTVTNDTICAGDSAILTASGAGGVIFEWFGSQTGGPKLDSVASYQTPPLTVTTNYYVQTSLAGCASARVKATVKVNPIPAMPTALSVGICAGSSVTLKATAPGGTYSWYNAPTGGTLLNNGPTYTTPPLALDTAFYVQTQVAGCVSPRKQVKVSVYTAPIVDISANDSSVCTGTEINFTNNSTTGGLYNWYFTGAVPATSSQYTPMPIKFTVAGIKLVYLSVNMNGCIKNDSLSINVETFPKTNFTLNPLEGCSPLIVGIKNSSTTVPGVNYFWDFDNGNTSSLQNPAPQTFTTTGLDSLFSVKLIMSSPMGCKDSAEQKVTVFAKPVAAFKSNITTACVYQDITFTSESLTANSWKWDFGDGATSLNKIPIHAYALAGTYTIKLVVTGSHGCSDSITHNVTVNPAPTASFVTQPVCNSLPTVFTDKSTGGATNWEWNFGDATPLDNAISPIHVYVNPGSYNVILSVKNAFGCIDTALQKVVVLEKPRANFSSDKVCAKQLVKLNDSTKGTNLINWNWSFGDGTINSTTQHTTHIYPTAGQYPVKLVVKNGMGCSDSIVKTIRIHTIPTPLFTANVVCLGKTTSFKDLSTDTVAIVKWFYDFGDGNNSISQNPVYVYSNPGVYNVSLTVTNIDGCDSTFTKPVSVDITPVVNYAADTICVNNPTTFTDLSTGKPIKWEWDFGDGSKDTIGPVTTHIYPTAGTFLTSLKVLTAGGCIAEKFKMVVVRNDVKAGITAKDTACVNEMVLMNDNTITNGSIASSSWNFGDGSPDVYSLHTMHAYTVAGKYVVTHIVIANGGCQNKVTDTVFVNSGPTADFTATGTCIGQESIFTDKSTSSPTSWSWDFKDGTTSTLQHPKHTFLKAGTYQVLLFVTSGLGCSDTITKKITVYSAPKASFENNTSCWGDTTNFVNTSNPMDGSIINIWWDFDDGTTDSLLNPNHVFITKKDTFMVKMVIVTNHGCRDTITKQVKTYPLPKFKFAAAATSGCNKFTTSFHDSSTVAGGTIAGWLWNFGDKNLTYKNNVSHTYVSEGKFYVSLTLTTSYGCRMVDTLKYPIVVYPKPIAAFTATPDQVSMYEPTIKFTDESQKATMWDWNLGDGTTTTDQFFSHTYTDTGSYLVSQIAINPYGCMDTIQHTIRINGEPTMFIPNAFTPDGNGINDIFIPKMYGVREFNMSIYDRWGDLVFTSGDSKVGWNGKINGIGEKVKDDTYIYIIYVRDLLNNPHTYRGKIMLLKMGDKAE